ncbi:agamous MADS-box protein AGL62 [Trifolium repens]|nr:agamous MADS-box protein AGL62 [Trifolium repens]
MSSGRKTRGRQKVEMKKISNESNLQVTFSKRRSGLFKKASELCTLCGAEAAIVVFTPSEKVFSFGHPNVDTIIDRYLSRFSPQNSASTLFIEPQPNANVSQLNTDLTQINSMLDNEKKRHDELIHVRKMFEDQCWWASPIDGISWNQLAFVRNTLEDLKKHIDQHANMHVIQGPPAQLPYFVGNVSYPSLPLDHQSNLQMFPDQHFQNPMLQPHLFGFNSTGGGGGGCGPSGF